MSNLIAIIDATVWYFTWDSWCGGLILLVAEICKLMQDNFMNNEMCSIMLRCLYLHHKEYKLSKPSYTISACFSHGHRWRRAVSFRLTEWMMMREGWGTLSKKSSGAGHRAVSLHRDCVLVFTFWVFLRLNYIIAKVWCVTVLLYILTGYICRLLVKHDSGDISNWYVPIKCCI